MRNIQFYDSNRVEGRSVTIIIDNGKIENIAKNYTKGTGIRALCDGSWGYTSVDGDSDKEEEFKNATNLAVWMNEKTPREKIELEPIKAPSVSNMPKVKSNPEDISIEEKVEFLREIEKHAQEEGIKSTRVSYSEAFLKTRYESSEGVEAEYHLVRTGFSISAVASENGAYQVGRESRFSISGYEIFEKYDPFELAKHAAQTAKELLGAKTPKGGQMPVILDQELAGVFTHEAVGHASEADLVLQNDSVLKGKLGTKIGSPLITVVDNPSLHEYGFYPFDAEGVEAQKTVLIQKGVLNSYLHSRETGSIFKSRSGNARSQGYSIPVVRMSNTYIENGESKFEEMLEDVKNGIYLVGSRGGQVNTGEGVFQFNAEKGYLIQNGEITTLVRDVSLSGRVLDILNQITHVGNDLKLNAGHCGKSGQTVPVSDGAPHISISKATVGGA
ncbi:TldD/PmbA family protein [Methanolapillus ohkumae]|uniref:Metalloprotease TldD n=1 Tax=Methanolapillus ohkumae TaxID=3028298 RepID=A0AA97A5X0_9EURY|nr:Metalloprotease TldD [Methanosarcinaceae archaeon Am2]